MRTDPGFCEFQLSVQALNNRVELLWNQTTRVSKYNDRMDLEKFNQIFTTKQ